MATVHNQPNKLQTHTIRTMRGATSKAMLTILVVIGMAIFYGYFSSGPDVVAIGKKELTAIRSGDMQTAYDLTSTTFKQQTKPEKYAAFIGQYPILQQYTSVDFSQQRIEKTTAAIGGILVGSDGRQMQIQFQFVKENNGWRIQGLSIAPLSNAEPQMQADHNGATIRAIVVSDVADNDGYVTQAKHVTNKLSPKIYVTVEVNAPKAGGKIEATLIQVSNGEKFGPSVDNIEKTGNILKAFAFTKVTNAWNEGEYEVDIRLSSGDAKALKFTVK